MADGIVSPQQTCSWHKANRIPTVFQTAPAGLPWLNANLESFSTCQGSVSPSLNCEIHRLSCMRFCGLRLESQAWGQFGQTVIFIQIWSE